MVCRRPPVRHRLVGVSVPVLMRTVRSRDELVATFGAIARQFSPPLEVENRLAQLMETFDRDRPLMLCIETGGTLRGGVVAVGVDTVGVRGIGVDEELRGMGAGRRLLEAVEAVAMARGARLIALGSVKAARGFYERLGYRGKRTGKQKELPLPGRVRDLRAAQLLEAIGDLDVGVTIGQLPG